MQGGRFGWVIGLVLFLAHASMAQGIDPRLGVDARVDYAALAALGPWDDRNYNLTREDLDLLAPDGQEPREATPVFYRVLMRKAWPELRRSGPAQYPRSALNAFRGHYGGYLIDGTLYRGARWDGKAYQVVEQGGIPYPASGWDGERYRKPPAISTDSGRLVTRFLSGEVKVTSPEGAAESAVAINPVDPDLVIAGSNGPGFGQIMHYSTDGGASWQTSAALPLGGTCCDPTVEWSSDGSKAYTATLGNCSGSGCGIWFYRSADNGVTWTDLQTDTPGDPRRELTNSGSDKEYLHVDHAQGSPYRDNLYLTWHELNVMQFARSSDQGNTWISQSFSSTSSQLGIGSDITTDRNGAVYYVWPAFVSQKILLRKSIDGGSSFAPVVEIAATNAAFIFPVPSMDTREVFVYVSADVDLGSGDYADSIYVAWTDSSAATGTNPVANHSRIQVAYSRDGGANWTVTTPHETADILTVDRYHPWLAVADDGSVHVIFYDTRRDASRQSVDLYHSYSADGAQTWSTPERVTGQQSPKINDSFEFGDYNGLDVVMKDLIAIYTDNRDESGGSAESVDVYAAGLYPFRSLVVSVTGKGSVSSNPAGILCPSSCSGDFLNDSSVDMSAALDPSWTAGSWTWSGACTGTAACTVDMTGNRTVGIDFHCQLIEIANPGAPIDTSLPAWECANLKAVQGFSVAAGGDVMFQASDSIELGADFRVSSGGKFRALVVP